MRKILKSIQDKITPYHSVQEKLLSIRSEKIVFTNGCFDILHVGHVSYLARAAELGDLLWIGLNSDSSVQELKGKNRPIQKEMDRALILASLQFVDLVTIFEQNTPIELIQLIQPNIHVKGGDYIAENLPEYKTVVSFGGRVEILSFVAGHSTTSILNRF